MHGARWTTEAGMVVRRIGHGPEVVWIHGLGEWSVSFDAIAQHPGLAGLTHVLVDLPGYGRSPWPGAPTTLAALADHLTAWLGATRPILVGHSMGGVLATLIGERIPVRAIVDIDGNLSRGDCTFSAQAAAFALDDFVAHGFATMRASVFARGASEAPLRGYHAAFVAADPRVFHAHAVDLVALSDTETLAPRLAALRVPALFVAGGPGGICARSHELLARHAVRTVTLAPSGHWPYIDQAAPFAAEVSGFLRAL